MRTAGSCRRTMLGRIAAAAISGMWAGLALNLVSHTDWRCCWKCSRGVGSMVTRDPLEEVARCHHRRRGRHSQADRAARSRRHADQAPARTAGEGNQPMLNVRRHSDRRLRRALTFGRREVGGTRLPGRASGLSRRRRRRAIAEVDRGKSEETADQTPVRAHHPRRALVHRARFCGVQRRQAAEAEAGVVQLPVAFQGSGQVDLTCGDRRHPAASGAYNHRESSAMRLSHAVTVGGRSYNLLIPKTWQEQ